MDFLEQTCLAFCLQLLTSHKILDTLLVFHGPSVCSCMSWRCFCFKGLLVHGKHSACVISCLSHIVSPSLMRAWTDWLVGCYSFVSRVLAFRRVVFSHGYMSIAACREEEIAQRRGRKWNVRLCWLEGRSLFTRTCINLVPGCMRELVGKSLVSMETVTEPRKEDKWMMVGQHCACF